jgi:nitrite reductase/ring-hydroxylating ferredoxin subunit
MAGTWLKQLQAAWQSNVPFGRALPPAPVLDTRPDWQQADPRWIRAALQRSQELPSGGWYVLDASDSFGDTPRRMQVHGLQLVVWRAGQRLLAARDACPHMGAALSGGRVCDGKLVCPWHGLALGPEAGAGFRPLLTHDDGQLLWVQLSAAQVPGGAAVEQLTPRPFLPARPSSGLSAVIRMEARCETKDVIANRLDPWHGAHYHPHSFGRLRVIEQLDDSITVRVAYRVAGPLAVEVDARFHCSDPRTIVMTILRGEGVGSVVETHATPLAHGQSAIIELTYASSERLGFRVATHARGVLVPLMRWAARRLWVEDAAYAERLYELRAHARERAAGGEEDGPTQPVRLIAH